MNNLTMELMEDDGEFDRMMKASEIAKALHVSRAEAYKLLQTGAIPRYQFGRCVRARKADVCEYIRKHYRCNNWGNYGVDRPTSSAG